MTDNALITQKKPQDQIVTKNVSAIHISARLSLTQRKLVNALLYHAYDSLLTEDTHTIPVALLMEMIGFESRNQVHLRKAIRGLTETSIEWDMMDDSGESMWEVATLLSYARIQKGKCSYRYDKSLAEKLYDPGVFAKINLSVVRDIRSAHTLALYENCYRYIGVGQTPKWSIDTFRKLMAVDGLASYQQFKILKRDLLTPSIKEINKLSNIKIEMLTEKNGRAVATVQFTVKRNPQMSLIGLGEDDDASSSPMLKELIKEGASQKLARLWVAEYDDDYIRDKITLARNLDAQGRIKRSKIGFLKAAIEEDYQDEEAGKKKILQEAESIKQAKKQTEARIADLRASLRAVENAHRKACLHLVEDALDALSEDERSHVNEVFEQSFTHRIFRDAFRQGGWTDRRIYADVRTFWESRGVVFPSPSDWAKENSSESPQDLKQKIEELEALV